jgi:ribosome-binding protein aMBF1 (putative translation factor)
MIYGNEARAGSKCVVKARGLGETDMKKTLIVQREIGAAVAGARKRSRLTQKALARALGTKQANISRIERGMQNLSLDLLIRLDRVLKMGLNISVR